ncbi:hypothetical protein Tco_0128139 [Tanacetum coccineum]
MLNQVSRTIVTRRMVLCNKYVAAICEDVLKTSDNLDQIGFYLVGGCAVVVLWFWCCGGGGAVVVVWCSCCCGFPAAVVELWLCSSVNMEIYEDPLVTLTIRDIDDSLENSVLIHFMSCRQVESLREDTEVVPFTYHLNGHYIEFGREEFCLIIGSRFGPEYSEHYVEGINPFRRLLFGSDIDGGHIYNWSNVAR